MWGVGLLPFREGRQVGTQASEEKQSPVGGVDGETVLGRWVELLRDVPYSEL
jgi:hypothetical protein